MLARRLGVPSILKYMIFYETLYAEWYRGFTLLFSCNTCGTAKSSFIEYLLLTIEMMRVFRKLCFPSAQRQSKYLNCKLYYHLPFGWARNLRA